MATKIRYRSLPLHLTTNDEFRELSLEAKGLLLTLVLHCHYTGLGRFAPGVLAIFANATSPDQLVRLLGELETGGWIKTDGNAVLIPDLLSWQSNYQATNENHRPNVENSIQEVRSPKLIEAFWSRYPEWRPKPSGSHRDAIPDGICGAPNSHEDTVETLVERVRDQVQEPVAEGRTNTKTDSNGDAQLSSIEFARALANRLDEEQMRNPGIRPDHRRVKADAAAAAELQELGVQLSFALEVAADLAINFRPMDDSDRIVSTRYVNTAVIERWRMPGPTAERPLSGKSASLRRRSFRDDAREAQDQALNKNPAVHAAVKAYMAQHEAGSPGAGEHWLEEMKLAKPADRYLYPFAHEWIKANGLDSDHGRLGATPSRSNGTHRE